jgi:soluble P-type ATPase
LTDQETGLAGLEDPPRPEVPEAFRKCQEAGIKVIMVTGDHPRTATAIAREIGLVKSDNPTVITGEQLKRFSLIQLQLALDAQEIIFARVVADQKMRIVEALKKKRQIVAVTGDGVNDAPTRNGTHWRAGLGLRHSFRGRHVLLEELREGLARKRLFNPSSRNGASSVDQGYLLMRWLPLPETAAPTVCRLASIPCCAGMGCAKICLMCRSG